MSNAQRVKLRKECVKSVEECGTSKWLPVTLVIYGRIVLCCHGYNYNSGSSLTWNSAKRKIIKDIYYWNQLNVILRLC